VRVDATAASCSKRERTPPRRAPLGFNVAEDVTLAQHGKPLAAGQIGWRPCVLRLQTVVSRAVAMPNAVVALRGRFGESRVMEIGPATLAVTGAWLGSSAVSSV
jgi:hypothetical protein